MLRKIVCLALPGMAQFEFGTICEVFGVDRRDDNGPVFEFHVVAADPGSVPMSLGLSLNVSEGLEVAFDADLIAVPAYNWKTVDPRIMEVVKAAADRGAWVLSVCSGSFVLGEAGLLNGRRSTTHWRYSDRLAKQYPLTHVDPNVLFVEDGNIVTGAGTAAGIDAALHIVRKELGAGAANIIARRMVVPPQRDGGQSQYIRTPVPVVQSDSFAGVTAWMLENLHDDLSIDQLARRAHMSARTFARRFRAEMGTTPAAWLNRQRIMRAQHLLEESDLGLEQVAQTSGFGTAAVMRHHFTKVLQTNPLAYRRTFGASAMV